MYKIVKIRIDEFWHRFNAECAFHEDVNIIIGRNGTGKTTFMNILHSVLAVDLEGIANNEFESIEIKLEDETKKRTIKAKKIDNEKYPFVIFEYHISNKKYRVRLMSDDLRLTMAARKRAEKESEDVREALESIVALSSLSVHRISNQNDVDIRETRVRHILSPVDYRLSLILGDLTRYQLELSQRARTIGDELQKDVLGSILYDKDLRAQARGGGLDFDKEQERKKIIYAYTQLNAIDSAMRKRIQRHVDAIEQAFEWFKASEEDKHTKEFDIYALEAHRLTRNIIEMSLEAEVEVSAIYSQLDKYLDILSNFIQDKHFEFDSNGLSISNEAGKVPHEKLSSGEKQLLILLTEALLQKQLPHVFMADEPELSLHIEWQRNIIPAVMGLNPNAQVIVATHSPEVASKYQDRIINMENIVV